jgi:hypothetical protein
MAHAKRAVVNAALHPRETTQPGARHLVLGTNEW